MVSILLLGLYIFLIFFVGFLTISFFHNCLNHLEKIGASFGLGLLANYLIFIVFTIIGVKIDRFSILAGLIITSVVMIYFGGLKNVSKMVSSLRDHVQKADNRKTFFFITVLTLIGFWFAWMVISEGFWYGDEFSFWGKAIRMIYNLHSLRIQNGVLIDFSGYPLLVPAGYSGIAFMTKGLVENYLKILNIPVFISIFIFAAGYLERLKFTFKEKALSLLLLFTSGYMLTLFATLAYADLFFLYAYMIGTFLLISYVTEKDTNLLYLSGLFLITASSIRANGFVLAFISIGATFVVLLREKQNWKKLALLGCVVAASQVLWAIFVTLSGASRVIPYSNQLFDHVSNLFSNSILVITKMLQSLFLPNSLVDGWGAIWWLILPTIILSALYFKTRESWAILINVLLNFAFLVAIYLFVFQEEEMKVIASFPRYVLGFLPVALLGVAYTYKYLKENANEKSN